MERIARTDIRERDEGKILLEYIALRFQYYPVETWRDFIADGQLTVNGGKAPANYRLALGDTLSFTFPPIEEPPVRTDWKILHEDGDFLAVDKPAPLPVHPAGIYFKHTLWHLLKERPRPEGEIQDGDFIHFAGRLDRETSGVLLVCKNRESAAYLQRLHDRQEIEKEYEVLVHGEFVSGSTDAVGWLLPDSASAIRKKRRFIGQESTRLLQEDTELAEGAEFSSTRFTLLETGGGFSRLSARLQTGRTHQIRATLCSLGFPVVGDKLYGTDEGRFIRFLDDALTEEDRRGLILDRQALHSSRLCFRKQDGDYLEIRSAPPFSIPPAFGLAQ